MGRTILVDDEKKIGDLVPLYFEEGLPRRRIALWARAIGAMVSVAVSDTGSGIDPEHLPYVFDRFYRAERSRARQTGGAGLGLAVVKQLVTTQGGTVDVASEAGKGSTFTFTVPIAA